MKIGILGANGFIGRRAVEMLHVDGVEVRSIVRSSKANLNVSDLGTESRIANALDRSALQSAFAGCDIVIHSILGNPGLIRGSVKPAYQAAEKAGVHRLIYLSSMCVHGQCPAPGTIEETPLNPIQPFPYNSAKIYAEQQLLKMRSHGSVEVVIFRPGIVFGPRSRWVTELAQQLTQGTAYLINDGKGICNSVYIDNLVHAIRLAINTPDADGQAFFVGDREQVTWLEFYRSFAEALGFDPSQISYIPAPKFEPPNWKQQLKGFVWDSGLTQKVLSLISDDLKRYFKKKIKSTDVRDKKELAELIIPVSKEMVLLQESQYKLPFKKAERILNYKPIVSFKNACQQSTKWLNHIDIRE